MTAVIYNLNDYRKKKSSSLVLMTPMKSQFITMVMDSLDENDYADFLEAIDDYELFKTLDPEMQDIVSYYVNNFDMEA